MNDKFWMSIKSAESAVYANRVMLDLYGKVGISFIKLILTPTPSLLEIAYAVAVVRCGTFLVLTRSLFFIFLELNLSLQVC